MSRPLLPNVHPGQYPSGGYGQNSQADPAQAGGVGGSSPGGGSGGGELPPSKPTYSKRGKITIVACVPCRRRKTKCDGQRPVCSQCQARDGECIYDMTDDQRKLTFLRENVEQLQEKSTTLESLFATVQSASEEEASEVFRRIRSGANIQTLADQVQAGRLLSGVAGQKTTEKSRDFMTEQALNMRLTLEKYDNLVRIIATGDQEQANAVVQYLREQQDISTTLNSLTIGSLTQFPTLRQSTGLSPSLESSFARQDQMGLLKGTDMGQTHVKMSLTPGFNVSNVKHGWSMVTTDLNLINYLLDLYFTWQHSFFQNFPEDLFRNDFASGRTKYCSSILVNAICAAGCFLSDREEIHAVGDDGYTWSLRFYHEATKLLSQMTESTITTTASMFLISYIDGTRGRLSELWNFSGRSTLMAVDINLHLRRILQEPSSQEEASEQDNEERARSHAFWGCFHVDQLTSLTLGRLPKLNANGVTIDLPRVDLDLDEKPWVAIGYDDSTRPHAARSSTFHWCSMLSRIVNSTLYIFFAPAVPLSGSLLVAEYQKYAEWKESLPEYLTSTTNVAPHIICLHMYYSSAVLLLFRPFLKATIDNSELVPREICRQSAATISGLWREHIRLYSNYGIFMFQVHCLLTACTIHILNIPSVAATRDLTEACNIFQALRKRNAWAGSALKILRDLVTKWSLILPMEVEEALYRDSQMPDAPECREFGPSPGLPDPKEYHLTPRHRPPLTSPESGSGSTPTEQRFDHPTASAIQQARQRGDEKQGSESFEPTNSSSRQTSIKRSISGPSAQGPSSNDDSQEGQTASVAGANTSGPKRPRIASAQPNQLQPFDTMLPPPSPTDTLSPVISGQIQDAQRRRRAPPVQNFLYAPLANQPAPLLQPGQQHSPSPVGSTGSANVSRSQGEQPQQQEQSARSQQQRRRAREDSGDSEKKEGGEGKSRKGVAGQVEGLTFGDDWRDPFMGFLGQ